MEKVKKKKKSVVEGILEEDEEEEEDRLSILSLRLSMTSHGRKYHAVREVQSAGLLRGPGLDLSRTRAKILDPVVVHTLPSRWETRETRRSVSRSVGRRRGHQFDARLFFRGNLAWEARVANRIIIIIPGRRSIEKKKWVARSRPRESPTFAYRGRSRSSSVVHRARPRENRRRRRGIACRTGARRVGSNERKAN